MWWFKKKKEETKRPVVQEHNGEINISKEKHAEIEEIIAELYGAIVNKYDFFYLPDWEYEDAYNWEEELTKLGLCIFRDDEEIEMLLSDSKYISVEVMINWEQINLEYLKEILLPVEKWESGSIWKKEAIYIWTYAYMRITGIIDIDSRGCFPGYVLSNLCPSEFEFENVKMNSMEGFLQSLKTPDETQQKEIQSLSGKEAKKAGESLKNHFDGKHLYWQGKTIDRFSDEYQQLLKRVFRAKWEQDTTFQDALSFTQEKKLIHSIGKQNPEETILTEKEYITLLEELRNNKV